MNHPAFLLLISMYGRCIAFFHFLVAGMYQAYAYKLCNIQHLYMPELGGSTTNSRQQSANGYQYITPEFGFVYHGFIILYGRIDGPTYKKYKRINIQKWCNAAYKSPFQQLAAQPAIGFAYWFQWR